MGEYEPEDSRNITGTESTKDGRWTNDPAKAATKKPDEADPKAKDKPLPKGGQQ